jgi:hypothetical protein
MMSLYLVTAQYVPRRLPGAISRAAHSPWASRRSAGQIASVAASLVPSIIGRCRESR